MSRTTFASLSAGLAGALAALLLAAPVGRAQPAAAQPNALPSILVSADWLAARLDEPDLVVLHVLHPRQAPEYDAGHIPGARLLRYDRIAGEVEGTTVELLPVERLRSALAELGVGDRSRVVLVGEPMSAARAWVTLDYLGLGDRAAVLDGGMPAWRAGGHPLSRETPAAQRATLTVRPQTDRFVDAAWVRARLGDPAIALVDARPASEYTGSDGGHDGMHRAGHIPGARNLYWERLVVSRADPRLRPAAELRALLEEAGASRDRTTVAYCFIGMRASVLYFVSRLLGYETRFYDGSWEDWSRRGLPAVLGAEPGAAPPAR